MAKKKDNKKNKVVAQVIPSPTIGRIVQYRTWKDELFPAIIIAVEKDDKVSLNVFTKRMASPVDLVLDCERGSGKGKWDWLPYTKEQNCNINIKNKKDERTNSNSRNQGGDKGEDSTD